MGMFDLAIYFVPFLFFCAAKVRIFLNPCKCFLRPIAVVIRYDTLMHVLSKYLPQLFAYIAVFQYLCSAEEHSCLCKQIHALPWVAPSSPSVISPTSSRSQPGISSARCSPIIPTWRTSPG